MKSKCERKDCDNILEYEEKMQHHCNKCGAVYTPVKIELPTRDEMSLGGFIE